MAAEIRDTIGGLHVPLRDQVLVALRQRIVKGDYPPGERLTEDRLAEDFGVSRNPVREALRVVQAEGFVIVVPRRGAVAELNSELHLRVIAISGHKWLSSIVASLYLQVRWKRWSRADGKPQRPQA